MALKNGPKSNEHEHSSNGFSLPSSSSSASSAALSAAHLNRLAVLSGHLQHSPCSSHQSLARFHASSLPTGKISQKDSLTVVDNRTGKSYDIPISEGGTIKATAFKQVPLPLIDEHCYLFPIRSSLKFHLSNAHVLSILRWPSLCEIVT
jgi:hypothetical protein